VSAADIRLILIIAGIVFNFGGFVWLARNHFHSVNKRLDSIELRLHDMELLVTRIEQICKRLK